MSFGREKRLLLAVLSLLAPLPLPFNEVVSWGVLILFWLCVGLFLWRTARGTGSPLPIWAMNLLGVAYLPILLFDFVVLWQGRLLRPLIHLALFALVVKLFGMKLEKDKWHILLLCFFVFMAAMGSSVHPTVVIYLTAFLALTILTLARFASYHVLSTYGLPRAASPSIPLRGFVIASTLASLLGAIPLFILLPRLGSPYVLGPGGSAGNLAGGAGVTDFITLDVIGRVRTSRAVAMRVAYETPPPQGHERRYRAGVYTEFRGNGWERETPRTRAVRRQRDGFFHVAEGRPRSWAEIWLEPGAASGLVLPIETVVISAASPSLQLDQQGVVSVPFGRGRPMSYRAGMGAESRLYPAPTESQEIPAIGPREQQGVSEAVARLAREVAGEGSAAEKARRLEQHLMSSYEYTLDLVGNPAREPIEDFLFRTRRGHCEYFASSLVLMLRAIDIPARLATGYLGGEYSPFEDYYVVRQSDAHAWVEAYLPGAGWSTLDPTPAAGRPSAGNSGWASLFSQAYDYVIFRWDRYVLTYGFFDQVGIARRLLNWWSDLWDSGRDEPRVEEGAKESRPAGSRESDDPGPGEVGIYPFLPLILVALVAAWWIWRHRPGFSAAAAYRRLRSRVEQDPAMSLASTAPPLRFADHVQRLRPPASPATRRVVDLYLRESFGGQVLSDEERSELRAALREALQGLRKSA